MKNSSLIEVLKRSQSEGTVVSVFSNKNEPDKCSVGIVLELSDEQIVIKHITPEGLNDGLVVRSLNDVYRVDINGRYEQRMQLLYNLQNQQHNGLPAKKIKKEANLFKETLSFAQKKNLIVRVSIDEAEMQEDIVGFVKMVNNSEVVVQRVSNEGFDDGESVFCVYDIVKVNCDSVDERTVKLLYSAQQGKA